MTLYKLQSVFIVIVTLLILCGCSKEKQMLNTNIMETALNYEKEYFSVYQLDGMESFDHLIAGNPIDQDYDYDFTVKATTTAEMIAVQTKYAEIWKNEYDFANENLINTLDETNQSTFRNLQNNWEKNMKERILFEQSLIDDAEISLGTAYQYLKISVYREEYRKRTLQTKYLHYLIESKGAENTENDNFISLIWKYKN